MLHALQKLRQIWKTFTKLDMQSFIDSTVSIAYSRLIVMLNNFLILLHRIILLSLKKATLCIS